jgi:hypothetical protein
MLDCDCRHDCVLCYPRDLKASIVTLQQTSAEALCRLFTETDRRADMDSHEIKKSSKKRKEPDRLEIADFKKEYNVYYNTFYSTCLASTAFLARRTTKIKSEGGGSMGGLSDGSTSVVSGDALRVSVNSMAIESSMGDVLEAFLTALCTSTDFAALSLTGEWVGHLP